ncbi:MAG: rhomboid family intramembrane serine protease [Bacteroidales bacterium]
MSFSGQSPFSNIPPVVKNLIIINIILLLAAFVFKSMGINLNRTLGLFYPASPNFQPYQFITHMFMHGGIAHLFFNMFALFMFGRVLEQVWGSKRFFIYFFFTGIGAALLHTFVLYLEAKSIMASLSLEQIEQVRQQGTELFLRGRPFPNTSMRDLQILFNIPTVGASGAVFGVLLAFGMYFPNTQLMLLFPPIPIRAKYFVIIYGAIELYLGFTQANSNIAHFAHLGGMLFGFILIKIWARKRNTFY